MAIGPIVVVVALVFRRIARHAMRQSQRAQAEVNGIVQETISGVAVAKNFRQEAAIYADFEATNNLAYRVQMLRVAVFGSIFPLLNTLSGVGIAVVIYAGGLLVVGKSVTVGEWYLFVQSLTIFFYPISSIASFWSQFQQGLAASERVFALIDADTQVVQTASDAPGKLRGEITFDHVWFAYKSDEQRSEEARSQEPGARSQEPGARTRRQEDKKPGDSALSTQNSKLKTDKLGAARLLACDSSRADIGDCWPYRRGQIEPHETDSALL